MRVYVKIEDFEVEITDTSDKSISYAKTEIIEIVEKIVDQYIKTKQ